MSQVYSITLIRTNDEHDDKQARIIIIIVLMVVMK